MSKRKSLEAKVGKSWRSSTLGGPDRIEMLAKFASIEIRELNARCDEAERAAQEWAEYAQANNEALQAMRAELESLRIEVQSLRAEMPAKLH